MVHRIYRAQIRRLGLPGIIIATTYTAGAYRKAEAFLIADEKFIGKRISFQQMPGADEEFALDEGLRQATIDLELELSERYKDSPNLKPENPQIEKDDVNLLVHARVRGRSDEALKKLYSTTQCEDLREALKPILAMPKISIIEI